MPDRSGDEPESLNPRRNGSSGGCTSFSSDTTDSSPTPPVVSASTRPATRFGMLQRDAQR